MAVGRVILPDAGPYLATAKTAESVVQAVIDLAVRNLSVTREYGHYLWVLGLLVWATAMFSSSVTFHQRRPLNGIVVVGLVLLIDMALTYQEQLPYLVVFSIASLILLVRYHVFDEQAEWVRRRIGDPAAISTLYLRGGTVFIVAAVAASVLLTQFARSAPLEDAWSGFGSSIIEATRSIQRLLPQGGSSRSFGSDFDPNGTTIAGVWNPGSGLEMTIRVPSGDRDPYYWRAVTWDEFTGNGWRVSTKPTTIEREAGAALLVDTGDAVDPEVSRAVTFIIVPERGNLLFSPLAPSRIDQATTVNVLGDGARLTSIARHGSGTYTVTALVPIDGTKPGQRNKSALRAAGTDYPADIKKLYTQLPDGAIPRGGNAEALLTTLVADVEVDGVLNPFDFAKHLEARFQQGGEGALFTYDSNVLDLLANECKELSTPECFATEKRGFCQYYATTMAVFLRAEGIPARVVQGYLPGKRDISGQELISNSLSHQWVEAYFPGYGWYTFDPTGGGLSQLSAERDLDEGDPVPSSTPRPSVSVPSLNPVENDQDVLGNDRSGASGGPSGPGPFIAIGALLVAAMGSLAFIAWQRGPRGDTSPERAYRTVTALAGRFGFGPRPNQTVYEYATALGDVLPIVRPELETVASARVETVYGRTLLGEERLHALRLAERRLRVNLLRLAFRRPRRRRR
jgi:transglutaminase-like putative cysteine protease